MFKQKKFYQGRSSICKLNCQIMQYSQMKLALGVPCNWKDATVAIMSLVPATCEGR